MQSDENYAQRRLLQYHQHQHQHQHQQQQQQQQQQSNYKNAQQTYASEPQISQSTCSSTSSSTISDSGSSVHTSTCSPPSDNYKFDIIANEEIARQPNKTDYDVKKEKYGHTNTHGHMDGHVASKGCGVAQNEHFYYVPTRYGTNAMLPSSSSSTSCTEHYNSNHTVTCHTVPSDSNSNKNNSCNKSSSSLLHCESVYDKPMHCESSSTNRTGGNKTITSVTANQQDIKKDTIYTQHNFNDYNNYQEKSKTNSTIYFSQPEYFSISNIPYMAPPSPAPCDRFIPPPPLASSSINDDKFHSTNSSLECYSNNAFPSPSPKSEHFPALARFILPPASATPTIDRQDFTCSPKKIPFRNNCPSDAISSYEMNRYATSSTKPTSSNDFCPPTFFNKFTPINSSYRDKYRSLSQCQDENFQERLPLSNIQTQTLPSKNGRYHHHNHHDNNAIMAATTSHRNYNNFPNTTNNYTTESSNHFLIAATDVPRQNAEKISNVEKYSHSNIQQSLQNYTNSPNDPNFTLGSHYKNSNPYKNSDRFATLPNLNNERLHNKMAKINMYSTNCNDKKFANAIESDQIQSQSNEQQQQQQHYQQVPSSAHIPVERYVPQTNGTMSKDMYKYTSSAVHYQDRYMTINTCTIGISPSERYVANGGDPYMRRDLGYHHHYRPQTPSHLYYQQYQPTAAHCHRIRYANNQRTPRCCVTPLNTNTQMDSYSSPGSSSSNSIASATCSDSYTCNILSPSLIRTPKNQCVKHGGCMASGGGVSGGGGGAVNSMNSMNSSTTTVEYIGASGGRLISSSTIGTPISTLPHSPIDACILANHCGSNCELQCNHIVEDPQTVVFEQTKPISSTLPIINSNSNSNSNSNNSCSNNNDGAGTIPNVCCAVVTGGTRKLVQSKTNKTTATKCNNNLTTTSTVIHNNGISNSNNTANTWKTTGRRNMSSSSSQSNTSTSQDEVLDSNCQQNNASHITTQSSILSMPSSPSSQAPQESSSQAASLQTVSSQPGSISSPIQLPSVLGHIPQRDVRDSTSPIITRRDNNHLQHSLSERIPNREKPRFSRSLSTKDAIKNYIKKETANFFGVAEDNEEQQAQIWMDRRKRLASRTYGELKEEFNNLHAKTAGVGNRPKTYSGGYVTSGTILREHREDRPDVLPSNLDDVIDGTDEETVIERPVRRKDSVARLTWTGLSYVVTTLARQRLNTKEPTSPTSRSFPPETAELCNYATEDTLDDDVFFDGPPSTFAVEIAEMQSECQQESGSSNNISLSVTDGVSEARICRSASPVRQRVSFSIPSQNQQSFHRAWRRVGSEQQPSDQSRPIIGASRVWAHLLDGALDNSDRGQYGIGWIGRAFGRSLRKSVTQQHHIRKQLEDLEDHRPFFTWWVTTVQVLVLVISLVCYGLGPVGLDLANRSGQVLVTSLSLQQVDYQEPANFWLGPRAADLIHLGAKFAPCMRKDAKIQKEIDKVREKERETACCIRNDDSGCVQSSRADCSRIISTWKKWSPGDSGPGGRISGSVCGLDPKYCDAPASVAPYEWPDDITKWPICRKTNGGLMEQARGHGDRTNLVGKTKDKMAEHMVCEVIGHPCCIGIHGHCRITTREYCDFVRGYFHEEASLCSQVSCMDDVCGMIPFYFPETPDQVYRLWTSLFLHAGILQLVITVVIQYTLMRDLEKLTGSLRIGIIYLGSGVAGNLASAIFVPYRAEVGPAGAQFGLLACLIVEVINMWRMLQHPDRAFLKLLAVTIFLFVIGVLPWVDNYAHLFGFVFGFLLSYALMPFVSFGPYDREKKVALIWVCLLSASFLFCCLIILFYVIPIYDCEICTYFNCVPLTRNFCASQNINFKREEPVV